MNMYNVHVFYMYMYMHTCIYMCMFYMYSATQFVLRGLPMTQKLIEQGYYLPVLRIIGNVTSMMFKQRKVLLNEPRYGWMDGWMDG